MASRPPASENFDATEFRQQLESILSGVFKYEMEKLAANCDLPIDALGELGVGRIDEILKIMKSAIHRSALLKLANDAGDDGKSEDAPADLVSMNA